MRLSLDEFSRELDLILSWGHRQIELVLSEDPEFGPDVVARYVELTRRRLDRLGGGVVGLCSPVYKREDYVRLRDAGLEWVVEWQETYHQPHFDRWHAGRLAQAGYRISPGFVGPGHRGGHQENRARRAAGPLRLALRRAGHDRARQLPAPRLWSGAARHRHSATQARARRAGIAKSFALYGLG